MELRREGKEVGHGQFLYDAADLIICREGEGGRRG